MQIRRDGLINLQAADLRRSGSLDGDAADVDAGHESVLSAGRYADFFDDHRIAGAGIVPVHRLLIGPAGTEPHPAL